MSGIVGSLLGGWMSDLLGRRTVLMVSTVPFLVGLVVLGLAYNFPIVLLSRAIQERDDIWIYIGSKLFIKQSTFSCFGFW